MKKIILMVLGLSLQFSIGFANDSSFITAARLGDLKSVKTALADPQINVDYQYYPSVKCRNDVGPTALIEAATKGHTEMVKLLLNEGANPNILDKTKALDVTYHDWDVYDHEYTFEYFDRFKGGDTALIRAAKEGHTDIVKLLLDAGADPNIQAIDGNTALILAARYQRVEIIGILLNKGAKLNIKKNVKNLSGRLENDWTALIEAANSGDKDSVKLLLNAKADPNIKDQFGYTALTRAIFNGHKDCVKSLLDAKADPNIKKDGVTPLIDAAFSGKVDIVRLLLDAKVDPNIQNNHRMTALMWAAEKGYVDIARLLLDAKADINIQNELGLTALPQAAFHGKVDIVKLLLDAKADPNIKAVDGSTALMHTAEKCYDAWTGESKCHKEIVRLLLDAGADSNIKDKKNRTVLSRLVANIYTKSKTDDIVQLIKNAQKNRFY